MEDIVKNFQEITERSDAVRKKVKEENDAIETARNAEASKRTSENSSRRSGEGRSEGPRPWGIERQFKQPTGVFPTKISQDFSPLLAQE